MAKRFSIPDLSLCPEDVDNWKNGNLMSTPTKGQKKGQTSISDISVSLGYQKFITILASHLKSRTNLWKFVYEPPDESFQ